MLSLLLLLAFQQGQAGQKSQEDLLLGRISSEIPEPAPRDLAEDFLGPASPSSPLPNARALAAQEKAVIAAAVISKLSDPASVQFEWSLRRDKITYCARFNAKNRFGGYVGFDTFLITYGGVGAVHATAQLASADLPVKISEAIYQRCRAAGYRAAAP